MTTARLTANSSAPHRQTASLNNPIEGISPFVQNTAPLITADLEGSGNGVLAQNLVTNPPKVAKQMTPPTSSLVTKPVPADYPLPVLETLSLPNRKSAARLQYFVLDWKKFTEDPWTLQTIQGYRIPFCRRPRQWRTRITRAKSSMEAQQMGRAIANLLAKGAVKAVQPQDDQFTLTLFLVQKDNGEFRPVINLRALNRFLGKESFKMEGLQVVRSSLQKGDFMMKLDVKDAYYAIPIRPSHRKYLRFVYQNRVYEFQCLPFGLSSAPGAFTKTLKPVLAVLHSLGIRIVIYIDDMLLLHQQSKVLPKMFAQVVAFLEKLGFLVKIEKCSVAPSQCIVFLGAKLDSTTMAVKTKHYFGYLPSSPSSGLCPNENSVHSDWTYEPCFSNRDHDGPSSLPRSPAFTPPNCASTWSWEQSVHPLELSVPGRLEVVGLRERTSEWLSTSVTPYRCHHLERCVQKGLGCSVPRDIYRRPLECGGSESTHQCLGITSSNLSSKSFTKTSATGAQTCPLTFTQYNSSGIYQQAGGHTLPCSDHSGTRTVGSSP